MIFVFLFLTFWLLVFGTIGIILLVKKKLVGWVFVVLALFSVITMIVSANSLLILQEFDRMSSDPLNPDYASRRIEKIVHRKIDKVKNLDEIIELKEADTYFTISDLNERIDTRMAEIIAEYVDYDTVLNADEYQTLSHAVKRKYVPRDLQTSAEEKLMQSTEAAIESWDPGAISEDLLENFLYTYVIIDEEYHNSFLDDIVVPALYSNKGVISDVHMIQELRDATQDPSQLRTFLEEHYAVLTGNPFPAPGRCDEYVCADEAAREMYEQLSLTYDCDLNNWCDFLQDLMSLHSTWSDTPAESASEARVERDIEQHVTSYMAERELGEAPLSPQEIEAIIAEIPFDSELKAILENLLYTR